MVQKSENYKGKLIEYTEPDNNSIPKEIDLTIDGKHVHGIRMEKGNYGTHLLPYMDYNSITEMAHDLIDKVPEFSGRLISKK